MPTMARRNYLCLLDAPTIGGRASFRSTSQPARPLFPSQSNRATSTGCGAGAVVLLTSEANLELLRDSVRAVGGMQLRRWRILS